MGVFFQYFQYTGDTFPGIFLTQGLKLCLLHSPANVGDLSLISGLGRFPGEENGNPLHYSCLGNPMDR